MAVQVKVSGINILLKDLDKYSQDVQLGVYKEVRAWAERTEADAKRDVPVDTGALQGSIRSVVSNNGLTWIVKAGGINNVNYAPFIEFGTGARVDQAFLQEYGLVEYAKQFRGKQDPFFPLPSRSYLYKNARLEFEKTLANIKKLLQTQ
jgi:HK97 gp10 family phage protein